MARGDEAAGNMSDLELQEAVEQFLTHEARLLDHGQWREWQKLFAPDSLYWIPASIEPYDPTLHISIAYDDPVLLADRIGRLESGEAHAQEPPSRTLHQISNVSVTANNDGDGDGLTVLSNQVIFEFKPNAQRRMGPINVFPGECEHRLVGKPGEWKIRSKKLTLLNADGTITNLAFLI